MENKLVEVIEIRDYFNKLIFTVNIKSIEDYEKLIKSDEYIILNNNRYEISFKTISISMLYLRQPSFEDSSKIFKVLENKLAFTHKDIFVEKPNCKYVYNIEKQTFIVDIDGMVFKYSIADVYSIEVYNFLKLVRPSAINEATIAFHHNMSYSEKILKYFNFKKTL
jgi:hypothetical protein